MCAKQKVAKMSRRFNSTTQDMIMSFAEWLTAAKKKKKLTLAALGKQMGLSLKTVQWHSAGKSFPTQDTISAYEEILGETWEYQTPGRRRMRPYVSKAKTLLDAAIETYHLNAEMLSQTPSSALIADLSQAENALVDAIKRCSAAYIVSAMQGE
jgi:transcriptional regulator with XRE-family HTH domain